MRTVVVIMLPNQHNKQCISAHDSSPSHLHMLRLVQKKHDQVVPSDLGASKPKSVVAEMKKPDTHSTKQPQNTAASLFPTLALLSAHILIFVADSLALVWLRRSPCSDRCCKVSQRFLVIAGDIQKCVSGHLQPNRYVTQRGTVSLCSTHYRENLRESSTQSYLAVNNTDGLKCPLPNSQQSRH